MSYKILSRLEQIRVQNIVDPHCRNKNLYTLFYDENIYVFAYENIRKCAIFPLQLDLSYSLSYLGFKVNSLVELMKKGRFHFTEIENFATIHFSTYIKFEDLIVEEVIRLILEAIYEPIIPQKNGNLKSFQLSQIVLDNIKLKTLFSEVNWFIQISSFKFFDKISKESILDTLRKKVQDKKFLALLTCFLHTNHISIISHLRWSKVNFSEFYMSILIDIYLYGLDLFLERLIKVLKHKLWVQYNFSIYKKFSLRFCKINNFLSFYKGLLSKKCCIFRQKSRGFNISSSFFKFSSLTIMHSFYHRYANMYICGLNVNRNFGSTRILKCILKYFLNNVLRVKLDLFSISNVYLNNCTYSILGYVLGFRLNPYKILHRDKKNKIYGVQEFTYSVIFCFPIIHVILNLSLMGFCDNYGRPNPKKNWIHEEDDVIFSRYYKILVYLLDYYKDISIKKSVSKFSHILRISCARTLSYRHKISLFRIFYYYKRMMNPFSKDPKFYPY